MNKKRSKEKLINKMNFIASTVTGSMYIKWDDISKWSAKEESHSDASGRFLLGSKEFLFHFGSMDFLENILGVFREVEIVHKIISGSFRISIIENLLLPLLNSVYRYRLLAVPYHLVENSFPHYQSKFSYRLLLSRSSQT